MSSKFDPVIDELYRLKAMLDQAQVDVDNARERFKDLESIQRDLDAEQHRLDTIMSQINIGIARARRHS